MLCCACCGPQGLDATLAADEGARREVTAALRGREERAAKGYMARLQVRMGPLHSMNSRF